MNDNEENNLNDDDHCDQIDSSAIVNEIKALGPHINSPVPNPAPLGLYSFGFTTALLQMKHTRLTGGDEEDMNGTENLAWGFALFYGGLLQFVAGLCEIRRNNIFGFTAFLSYGGFWMSLGTANIITNFYSIISGDSETVFINPKAAQAMFIVMGLFTFVLWMCTFKLNMTLSLLIFSLMMTFFLLAGGVDSIPVDYVAGWFGLFTASVAFWLASVELINDIIGGGNVIIPLGHYSSNNFRFTHGFHVPGRIHGVTEHALLQESMYGPGDETHPTLSERHVRMNLEHRSTSRVNVKGNTNREEEL
eukprot:230793_1